MNDANPSPHDFAARTQALNIYSGQDALANLPRELRRHGVRRALVLCGKSVNEKTDLIRRIETLAESGVIGVFAGITEGAPAECIEDAARVALELRADGLIAVGAGSVIKGARVVAMLMGEGRPLQEMATRHVEGLPPVSQRLLAPKLPIFNVLTSPTSAQHRAGSAVRYHGSAHHLEFFDPKTRPKAVFWDAQALATAPLSLQRSTSFEIYWWSLMCMGAVDTCNPLVQASRRQAWRLARAAYPRLGSTAASSAQIDLCAAALLQNRDEEDGGRPWSCHLLARAAYAVAVGVFNHYRGITQSHGYAGMAPAVIRHLGPQVPDVLVALGEALGLANLDRDAGLAERVASAVEKEFEALGWQGKLAGRGIPGADAPLLVGFALRNYNANHDRLLDAHVDGLQRAIEASLRV
ncbi:iron-containing alcohol dehydrogenase [Hydrogenophaga sp. BPS33]|uniref:iron-containing alcohol dehydrogenase n=1 Tax=Hydrogenophaga sp. BPS33 TaxID=2651974 RepID=UPI00135C8592|nr:iron-containing alcohol dehydrogenase [Hydrogenophaga sp. BPS33]